ncbi:hypothetical protein BO71DRAFT_114280 [Aspergillus ellipticus CBS 707.79]|uniref:Uncharacterized protein n=1 Tax=Aspergillus ellipticus CBS 707.79 TaxID=1448320 RepID=A0A319DJT6_9EURO|nr:hypothetical protein BO71DRAFT_114280 [Aspergillus ellipticus CBS 707.79]
MKQTSRWLASGYSVVASGWAGGAAGPSWLLLVPLRGGGRREAARVSAAMGYGPGCAAYRLIRRVLLQPVLASVSRLVGDRRYRSGTEIATQRNHHAWNPIVPRQS